jgi:hypothetical protein
MNTLIERYDIVISKLSVKHLRGSMNRYNQVIQTKEFYGFGIITGASNTFAGVYLPGKSIKLFKKINLVVVCKYNKNDLK